MRKITRPTRFAVCVIAAAALTGCGGPTPPPPLTITTTSLPNASLGLPYSQQINATGGVQPYHWSPGTSGLPQGLQLVPGGSEATISGTPTSPGQGLGFSITVSDSANHNASQNYMLSIIAEPDTLTLSPAGSLSFSPQLVGTPTALTATLSNTGTSAVGIINVFVTGPNGTNTPDFSQKNSCTATLAAGASCTITVTFTPSQFGPRTAALVINDDTVGNPHLLSVSGTGLTSGPNATLSANTLNLGFVSVGTDGSPQSLTLDNYGTSATSITGITATTGFNQANTCPPGLPSAAMCTINLTFAPTSPGKITGTLSVAGSAPGSPQTASLQGVGTIGQGSGSCTRNSSTGALDGSCYHPGTVQNPCGYTISSEPTSCSSGATPIDPGKVRMVCSNADIVIYLDLARKCP